MTLNRTLGLGLLLSVVLGAVFLWPAGAQTEPLSEAHLDRIRGNCVRAQHTIRQIHANDGLLRVNRGQIYEAVSVKLMVPMNSRITLNRLDGGDMVDITAAYDRELTSFRENYRIYERQLSSVMRINCEKSPQTFYDSVMEVNESRKKVHANIVLLHTYIRDYHKTFKEFSENFGKDATTEGES